MIEINLKIFSYEIENDPFFYLGIFSVKNLENRLK